MTSVGDTSLSSSEELEDNTETPRGSGTTKKKNKTTHNQTLEVVKSLADSFKSGFEAINDSLNKNFQIIGENCHVLNMQQFAYPETDTHDEVNIENIDENELPDEPEECTDGNNASQKPSEITSEEDGSVKSLLEKKLTNREKTGPKVNENLAKTITSLKRQKSEDDIEKNVFDKVDCPGLTKVKVNQVIWDLG